MKAKLTVVYNSFLQNSRKILIILVAFLILSSCSAVYLSDGLVRIKLGQKQDVVTVFAATSLNEAFTEIGESFELENPGVKVLFNFAGSQQLAQQLVQGAPSDVFASANYSQMLVATHAERVDEFNISAYANNYLAVIIPRDNPGKLNSLRDLSQPGKNIILADQAVPAGRYSMIFLENASNNPSFGESYMNEVLNNVVSEEASVRAVLSKIVLGEADAGIVYSSDFETQTNGVIRKIEIPSALNPSVQYFIAPIKDSQHLKLAQEFIAFVLSSAGQEILASHGFFQKH